MFLDLLLRCVEGIRISKLTKKHKADIGLSFDGDADRVIISDDKGNILDGDIILAMILKYHDFQDVDFRWKNNLPQFAGRVFQFCH